jgi:hypothetical protein
MRYLAFLLALPVFAEITPSQREAYFKAAAKAASLKQQIAEAQLTILTAKPASVEADAELQKAIAAMAKACGDGKLIANAAGDPVCEPAQPVKKDK